MPALFRQRGMWRAKPNNSCLQDHCNQRFSCQRNHQPHCPSAGKQQHFDAFASAVTSGRVVSQSNLTTGTGSVSDNTNVSISNVQGSTFGTATCNGPTSGVVTVTATGSGPCVQIFGMSLHAASAFGYKI